MRSTMLSRYEVTSSTNLADFLHSLRKTYISAITPVGRFEIPWPHVLRGLTDPTFSIGYIQSQLGVEIGDESSNSYFVNFGISGHVNAEFRGERVVTTSARAVVFNPGGSQRFIPVQPGAETLGIRLDRELVENELTALLGRRPDGPIVFDMALELTDAHHAGLRIVLESMIDQLDSESPLFEHPAVRQAHVRAFVTSLLLTHRHNFSERLHEGHYPHRPRHLRRALEFIDDNLGEPVTLGDIASAAECSARTLSDAFREHFDRSPMAFTKDRRLERVRSDLLTGSDQVSTAAYRWGFTNLGRFAALYEHRYGELPSATVARA
jgi:AraC-like DNA-binding protein